MPSERVGYVAKVFPRLSETFIVSELLAHERAGLDVEVFSLRAPSDVGVHAAHARLRAPVTEVTPKPPTVGALLDEVQYAGDLGDVLKTLADARDAQPLELVQAIRIARQVRKRGITHLHAHFANTAATVARAAARLAGVPYSLTAHAKDIFHEDVVPARLRRTLDDAATVVTVSDFNAEHLARVCPSAAARVHRIYNGLELDGFPYAAPRDRLPRIVGVGRLVEKKGFADLVDACALLAQAGREFECRIVGTGELEAELRARAAAADLEGVITFSGAASQEAVRAEMTSAAALAAPCVVGADGNRDGLPTVLLEAMALGTPCVSTDVTGIPEVLVDGVTGLHVAQRHPVALAEALGRLIDDAALRVRLAAGARRRIEERFDIDRNAAAWRGVVLGHRSTTEPEEACDARGIRVC